MTWSFRDWKDNLLVDRDAPVLAWRQEKGRRLGWENSHEALAWNVFRLGAGLPSVFGLGNADLKFWARNHDGQVWEPFEQARAALEQHLRGPDVNFAVPDVVLVDGRDLVFVDVGLATALTSRPPRWFSSAATPAAKRRRRGILDAMVSEEPDVGALFRRGLDETIRRGFYGEARRLLLARATARRLGGGGHGGIALLVNAATMRNCLEDAERFRALLGPEGSAACQVLPWSELISRLPDDADVLRAYLAGRTVNRAPAHLNG